MSPKRKGNVTSPLLWLFTSELFFQEDFRFVLCLAKTTWLKYYLSHIILSYFGRVQDYLKIERKLKIIVS